MLEVQEGQDQETQEETVSGKTKPQETALPDPQLLPYLDNEFVESIHGNRIFYTKDFMVAMYKLIHDEGKTAVEAYESLGFKVADLGKTRAEQAGKKAMEKAKKNELFTIDPGNYDGSVPPEKMPKMTMAEENAYLKAQNAYLRAMVEAQKKIQSILADSSICLSRQTLR